MNNSHDEIKKLLEASRTMLSNDKLNEDVKKIKKSYGIITEQGSPLGVGNQRTERENIPDSVEKKISFTVNPEDEKKQSYRVSGGVMTLHGKSKQDLELTTNEKGMFQETMDEFVQEVSDLADFGKLNVYSNNVEWSGHIVDMDIDFFFSVAEPNGLYIKGDMIKVDQDFVSMMSKLQTFYFKFRSKWAKVISSRKKTTNKSEE
jgi:hypothetical protein